VSQDDTTPAADLDDASRLPMERTFAALGSAQAATSATGSAPLRPSNRASRCASSRD